MITAAPERETPSRRPCIGLNLTLSWLMLGLGLVAGAVAIAGWQRVLAIWLASAFTLLALLLRDSIAAHA